MHIEDQQQPSLSHTDHRREQKRHAVYQQRQAQNPPTIATNAAPNILNTEDHDRDDAPHTPDAIRKIAADAETQPSQDSINALDKGGHLQHSEQVAG